MIARLASIRRIWWQALAALAVNFPFVGRLTFAWCPAPVLNCYACPLAQISCPLGSFQHFLVIGAIPFFVVGVIAASGLFAGRFWCSHACPFGLFQDLLALVPVKKLRLPAALGWGKYLSLVALAVVIPPIVKEPFFCTLCPQGTLEGGIPVVAKAWMEKNASAEAVFGSSFGILGMIGWWFWFKVSLLVGVVAASTAIRRPFCRTACPLGAMLGIFNRISLLVHPKPSPDGRLRLNLRDCPVGIVRPEHVDSHHCIKCRECYRKADGPAGS